MTKIKTLFNYSTFAICFSVILFSCQKESEELPIPDVTQPVISVTVPQKFASVSSDASVHIVGTVTDNNLQKLKITVWNLQDSIRLLNVEPNVAGKKGYTFNESYIKVLPNNANLPCMLEILASDGAGNQSFSQTPFLMN